MGPRLLASRYASEQWPRWLMLPPAPRCQRGSQQGAPATATATPERGGAEAAWATHRRPIAHVQHLRPRLHQGVEQLQRPCARLGVAVGNLGGVQPVAQQPLRVAQQLARKSEHLPSGLSGVVRGAGAWGSGARGLLALAAAGVHLRGGARGPGLAAAAGAAAGGAHAQEVTRKVQRAAGAARPAPPRPSGRALTKLVPSPISCCCACAAMTSSLAAGCCTSSSWVMVAASLVTNSLSRWFITILFMPAALFMQASFTQRAQRGGNMLGGNGRLGGWAAAVWRAREATRQGRERARQPLRAAAPYRGGPLADRGGSK